MLRPALRLLLVLVLAGSQHGCKCSEGQESAPREGTTRLPPPLKPIEVPSHIRGRLFPAVGCQGKLPVVLVLAEQDAFCARARKSFSGQAHLVCSSGSPRNGSQGEKDLHDSLAFLQRNYPGYVGPAPVVLVAGAGWVEVAWKMLLGEPQVFAFAYLEGLAPTRITSAALWALQTRGAQTLVLDRPLSDSAEVAARAMRRAGLRLLNVRAGEGALDAALSLLKRADVRFSPAQANQRPLDSTPSTTTLPFPRSSK